MSFSQRVKEELAEHVSKARHCQLAELGSILGEEAKIRLSPPQITLRSENPAVIGKTQALLKVLFHLKVEVKYPSLLSDEAKAQRRGPMMLDIQDPAVVKKILTELGFWQREGGTLHFHSLMPDEKLERTCCRRAYIRGAFLASGSVNDPTKNYHIEFLSEKEAEVKRLQSFLTDFDIDSRMLVRSRPGKDTYVLYLKDGEQIVDVLRVMKAPKALMELENIRVEKDMKNRVQRQVNCETANLSKTVGASLRQIEAIETIMEQGAFDSLEDGLKEIALLRLEHRDLPLKDLALLTDPRVSKSGVNHRLNKLVQIAETMKAGDGSSPLSKT